ncbi:cytochrome c [Vibrio scophthalmi]|uniref:c-type cytochrome n=1 Tax=Vibrio scophthalmi TaxID=45658 RepID=UPI0038733C79
MKPLLVLSLTALSIICLSNSAKAEQLRGQQFYQSLCTSCHGPKGHGDGIVGKALPEQPGNIYQGLNSWFESEAELIDTVLNGNEGIPAWGSVLSEQEVKLIFTYIEQVNE